ncbi:ABC transporter ATP-binding protein [Planomicrobium sp. YIM 101495]|uniref:ABC transporter ATP-binding protein n=1 Tax=Planomicrobium sp. YIM 101495 TaxID=2665160 RepID=UPI0012B86511|nr:ABC transporter ATP-binding protein [Planomicrobium sp. YIM 101495]MTD30651.1 ATP-binding cassette domain-containing protein [Planomicrobium sp. YIM 101495]
MTELNEILLEVKDLKTHFHTKHGVSKAVDGIDFTLRKGETLGIVGESGCGKSITSLSILRLIPSPPGKIAGGQILYKGRDLVTLPDNEMRKIRGNDISMIFQEPMTSLNPVIPVGEQIAEAIRLHQKMSKKEARLKAVDMLKLVGIPSPEKRAKQEPFQLSGGMRQRVMIAMALSCNPEVLIADEPTTALDVTIQAQILELIKELQARLGMGVMMITHDLGVVAETCDTVAVMYAGNIVEHASTQNLFDDPKHPYTRGLLASLPKIDEDRDELYTIEGSVPSAYNMPVGCRFASRCEFAQAVCLEKKPDLIEQSDGTKVRCWMYSDEWAGAKPTEEVFN